MLEAKIEKLLEETFQELQEGRDTSNVIAAVTGLPGLYTGMYNGMYNKHKESLVKADLQALNGEPGALTKNDNMLGKIGYSLAGAIPVVGSITNTMAANQRWDAVDKLNAARAKKGLPPID